VDQNRIQIHKGLFSNGVGEDISSTTLEKMPFLAK
jgi:hypothetical protein